MVTSSTERTSDSAPELTRPFLKWAGGKTRLLSKIMPHVPERIENYYEPFLGGGAMFFSLHSCINGTANLHDLNEILIKAWKTVRDEPAALLAALDYYKENDSKEFYYEQRQAVPATIVGQAAWFFYVNQTAWNGLWRVNKWGQFNVPWGDRAFRGISGNMLDRISDVLIGANITDEDFRVTLEKPQRGDFVYLDPPYLPISDTSKFYLYTERRFRASDLVQLAELCHAMTARGVHWIMSNRDTDMIRKLFPDNEIVRFTTRRSVAAQNHRDVEQADSPEALILGRPGR